MQQSESIKELAAALAKAQGQIKNADKDSTNPHFKSKYADLASVRAACQEPLSSNGLAVVQLTGGGPDVVKVTTRLMHSSGEWIEETLELKPQQATPQGIGSAITYARRYSLMAMVGVAPDDEDDGNAASTPDAPRQQTRPQAVQPVQAGVPQEQMLEARRIGREIIKMINDGLVSAETVRKEGKISSISDAMNAGDVESLIAAKNNINEYLNTKAS